MTVTNVDNQRIVMKEKIRNISKISDLYHDSGFCPANDVLAPTLDKWSMFCLFNLAYYRTMRFGELRKNINGISARMLSVTLKRLEKNGFVERTAYSEVPPRVEYAVTEFGAELSKRLVDLSDWFLKNYEENQKGKSDKTMS